MHACCRDTTIVVEAWGRGRWAAVLWCAALAGAATWAPPASAQAWKPEKNVDIVVSSGAGGAADRSARTLQKFIQAIPGVPSVSVTNKPGGSGTVAWTFVNQHPGDAHYISTLNTALVTNQIMGMSHLRYQDVTPLAIMMREHVALWTRAESPIASAKDLLARLRRDPASVSFGLSPALGNQNHIVLGMLARAAGVDPRALKVVVFSSGGAGMTAALGGHVDVWAGTAGSVLGYLPERRIRVIGMSAAERQPGPFAEIPTFREQGVDAMYYAWRGYLGPRGLAPAQTAFWDDAFAKIVASEAWKGELEKNAWGADFKRSAETRKHLAAEHELLEKMLTELGVVKR